MKATNRTRLRLTDQRGSIAVVAAFSFPVLLLLTALVIDVGNWYTHKRSLQNRADAGALAAGYQYLSALKSCAADASDEGAGSVALTNAAKQYAGAASDDYNTANVNDQSEISVGVNSNDTDPFVDYSDLANPCKPHPASDAYSPKGSLWTDIKVREKDIGTLAGGFGLNLSSVTAQARVAVKQLIGVRAGGLPFVNETGDQVDCAWAEFVDATSYSKDPDNPQRIALLGGTANPVPLSRDAADPRHWTAVVGKEGTGAIDLTTTGTDDIGVRYWLGTKTAAGSCNYDPTASKALTGVSPDVPIDFLNVYSTAGSPANNGEPVLRNFTLMPGSCGRSYLFTASLDPTASCTVNFAIRVSSGDNKKPTKITVASSTPEVASADATNPGTETGEQEYTGSITFYPNATDPTSKYLQAYNQVGLSQFSVKWEKKTGQIGAKACTAASPCTGTFVGGGPLLGCGKKDCKDETWQHATYVSDPIASKPIMSAELMKDSATPLDDSWPKGGLVPKFTIDLKTFGIDQQRVFLIRDSVQNTGNRTHAIDCGQGNGGLKETIKSGCPDPVGVNVRNDACSPQPAPAGYRDCVEAVPGEKTSAAQGMEARFKCSYKNNWQAGVSPSNLSDSDPRYAYIFLTSWGRITNSPSNGKIGKPEPNGAFPIRAFLRVYITGWDTQGGGKDSWETCSANGSAYDNDPPPLPYDSKGAVLWGHFVDVITLEGDDVIVGDNACDLSASIITCQPQLVR